MRGQEDIDLEPIKADIPNLLELVERGRRKKMVRDYDLKCRLLEVFFFALIFLFFALITGTAILYCSNGYDQSLSVSNFQAMLISNI